jgi:mannose-6-phosphate isomerase-like protein (cupin superfamily)
MLVKKFGQPGRLLDLSETNLLKAGFVVLKSGEEIGEHINQDREEILIVLSGNATVVCEGEKRDIGAGFLVYMPENSKHNVRNRGNGLLKYIYLTADLRER